MIGLFRVLAWAVILAGVGTGILLRLMPVEPARVDVPAQPVLQQVPRVDLEQLAFLSGQMRMIRRNAPVATTTRHALSDYSLLGVVEVDDGGWALLQDLDGVLTVRLGEQANGYELVALSPDGAVFARDGEEVILERAY